MGDKIDKKLTNQVANLNKMTATTTLPMSNKTPQAAPPASNKTPQA